MSNEQRARLAAQRAAETDPVQREAYALAARAGFDWYDTESAARRMAEHAAQEIVALVAALERMLEVQRVLMPGIRYISVPDYALLNDAPLEAQAALKAARGES